MTDEELLDAFREEVCLAPWANRGYDEDDQANPSEWQWYDMSIGWFLARGCDIGKATQLAIQARYHYEYWHSEHPGYS